MICSSPLLIDQLHYYLAYFAAHNLRGSLEISLNNGEPRLVTPDFQVGVGHYPAFDFQAPPLTDSQASLIAWLSRLLPSLADERAECKILIHVDPYQYGADMPYKAQIRLHRGLNGRQR